MTIDREDQDRLSKYLLGELTEAEEEIVELRLLVDSEFSEEFEMLEDELIDQYVEDALPPEQRQRLEQRFFESPERRRKLRFALALRDQCATADSPEKQKVVPLKSHARRSRAPFSLTYLRAAAVILVALGIGFGIWLLSSSRRSASEIDEGTQALNQAYKNQRLIEPRVTAIVYAPLIVTRGPEKPNIDEESRELATRLLRDAAKKRRDAKSYHALGRSYLVAGQLDEAVQYFEKALGQEPNNATLQSDMGAALLELGRQARLRDDHNEAFSLNTRALEHIDKALQLNPDLTEALFNRALCLQNIMSPAQAREAWQNYLKRDSQSKWAEEASRKLAELSERSAQPPSPSQLLDEFLNAARVKDEARAWQLLSQNREVITGKMIPAQLARAYVSQSIKGRAQEAQQSLRALLFAGELDQERGADPYTNELANYYAASSDGQRRVLAGAIEEMRAGYELCMGNRYEEAERRFRTAQGSFQKVSDIWEARLADYWIAYCLTQYDRINESNALLRALDEFCAQRSYKWLSAQALGWLATNHAILGKYSDSIAYNRRSLALAEAISDSYQMQKALVGMGSQYANLQQPRLSIECYYRSFYIALQTNSPPRQAMRSFTQAGAALFTFKRYAAAAAFTMEALSLKTSESNDPSLLYEIHFNLAQIYSKLQRFDEALQHVAIGLQIADSMRETEARQKITAITLLKQANIWREAGDCAQALVYYNQGISLYEKMEFNLFRYAAYKGRLLCERTMGDRDGMERDIPALVQLFEESRKQIHEEQNRNTFFDTEQDAYDIAVEYEHEKHNYTAALNYAENARARSLFDALSSRTRVEAAASGPELIFQNVSQPPDIESVRQNMPPQVHVLMYTVLPTKLLIWSISRDHFSAHEKRLSADTIEADINVYLDSLRTGRVATESGAKLYDILLGSAIETIEPGKKVCIIPDKFLYRLPFAALISPSSGKYLIEERALLYAPSMSVLWYCTAAASRKGTNGQGTVLSIGNPTFNRRAYPDLLPLEAAEREAREVAKLYMPSIQLLGREATKAETLRAIRSAEVVHFAGHYVVDNQSQLLSKMLLADDGAQRNADRSSDLSVFEILERRFDRTKLIVLSGCQTGLDRHYNGEGAVGLSRAFIVAGVPLVVASQWPVDSEATANLMISFHRYRRSGLDTVEALGKAQIEMLRGSGETYKSPYYWAAFLCVGGYAEF
ncbi:MAG TPA: CHAT domain-containing protein [Pyrinomonadaceae bacterium]|nr:CHAT domain-containing protein [Pyrinomonadaceae bacterium]